LSGFGAAIEVVRHQGPDSQVLIASAILEHVVDGGEDRGGDGTNGFFGAALCFSQK
jgi:hypothetical protein